MKKYRETGLKLTPQRIAILEFLNGNKNHPSAEDIYTEVSGKFPTMSLATVYNTLEAIRQKGGILELNIDPGRKRFDPNTEPHNHLICLRCRKIVDIQRRFELSLSDTDKRGFDISGNHIEFYGICQECKTVNSEK